MTSRDINSRIHIIETEYKVIILIGPKKDPCLNMIRYHIGMLPVFFVLTLIFFLFTIPGYWGFFVFILFQIVCLGSAFIQVRKFLLNGWLLEKIVIKPYLMSCRVTLCNKLVKKRSWTFKKCSIVKIKTNLGFDSPLFAGRTDYKGTVEVRTSNNRYNFGVLLKNSESIELAQLLKDNLKMNE